MNRVQLESIEGSQLPLTRQKFSCKCKWFAQTWITSLKGIRSSMKTDADDYARLFSREKLDELFPAERADMFFDALLGDAAEGSYDIRLAFDGFSGGELRFDLELHQRPRKCLACNLTYGLPNVFARHPVINIQGLVDAICRMMNGRGRCGKWKLGATQEKSRTLHVVPLIIEIEGQP
jgi:hypothetical protein